MAGWDASQSSGNEPLSLKLGALALWQQRRGVQQLVPEEEPMVESIHPYLNFNGEASDAIELYKSALDAKVSVLMRWSEMKGQEVPAEVADNVMYAKLSIGGGEIELSDVPPHVAVETGGNTFIALQCDDPKALDGMFEALAEGGQVEMPLDDMFWGARYGKLRDRFGIVWSFNCPLAEQEAAAAE